MEIMIRLSVGLLILWFGLTAPTESIILAFVVLGQGHFLSAYFYKLRHRQVTPRGLILFILTTTALFGWYWLAPNYTLLALVTQTYFMIHFLVDEKFLARQSPSGLSALEMIPIILYFVTFHLVELQHIDLRFWTPIVVLGISLLYVMLVRLTRYQISTVSFIFIGLAATLVLIGFLPEPIAFTRLIGMVILYHYAHWYLSFYFRFRAKPAELTDYFQIILLANLGAIGLDSLYHANPVTLSFLGYLYNLPYFFLWTIIHLIFSTRKKDQDYLLRLVPDQ